MINPIGNKLLIEVSFTVIIKTNQGPLDRITMSITISYQNLSANVTTDIKKNLIHLALGAWNFDLVKKWPWILQNAL